MVKFLVILCDLFHNIYNFVGLETWNYLKLGSSKLISVLYYGFIYLVLAIKNVNCSVVEQLYYISDRIVEYLNSKMIFILWIEPSQVFGWNRSWIVFWQKRSWNFKLIAFWFVAARTSRVLYIWILTRLTAHCTNLLYFIISSNY